MKIYINWVYLETQPFGRFLCDPELQARKIKTRFFANEENGLDVVINNGHTECGSMTERHASNANL